MLYIRNLAAIFRKVGQLFTSCHLWSRPSFFHCIRSQCQRYVWLHYQRSTIACLHRLGAWIWQRQNNVRLRAKQKEFYQMYLFFSFDSIFWSIIFFALCDLTVEQTCVQQGSKTCAGILGSLSFQSLTPIFRTCRFRISLCDLCCGYPWTKWRTCGSVGPGPLAICIVKTAHLCL